MKRILFFLPLLFALYAPAQPNPSIIYLLSAASLPASCTGYVTWEVVGTPTLLGTIYTCQGGVPTLVSGGSGSGTVNSGTAGQLGFYPANGTAISGSPTITTDVNGRLSSSRQAPSVLINFGDSIGEGSYSTNTNTNNFYKFGYDYYAARNFPGGEAGGHSGGYAMGGAYAIDVAQLDAYQLPCQNYGNASPAVGMWGTNEAGHYTSAYQRGVDTAADMAVMMWELIPCDLLIQPPSGEITQGGSGWVLNTTRIPANTGALTQTFWPTLEDNVNGDTLSFSVTTNGGPIAISYEAEDANSGAATVAIDGTPTGVTLQSGNSCPGTTGPASNSACIYTATWLQYQTPQTTLFTVTAGTHTVLLTVSGATGSGMGFSFIAAGTTGTPLNPSVTTNPIASAAPTFYHMGVIDGPEHNSIYDTFDNIYQANVEALQAFVPALNVYYICGLSATYSSFTATSTSVQPQGCSDVTANYLDNTALAVSTSAYSSATGIVTIVMQSSIPTTNSGAALAPQLGDLEILSNFTNEPTLNTTTAWTVQSISGSTMTLANPNFTGTTWSATADTGACVSKDFWVCNVHPNSQGYYAAYKALNHYLKAPGGGVPSNFSNNNINTGPPANANFSIAYETTSYAALGNEGIIQMQCSAAPCTVTLPKQPILVTPGNNYTGAAAIIPNNGPIHIDCVGTYPCTVGPAAGVTAATVVLSASQGITAVAGNSYNLWLYIGLNPAATSFNCVSPSTNYTLIGTEPCIRTGNSGAITITLPDPLANGNGNIPVFNTGTGATTFAAGSGASLQNLPTGVPPGGSVTLAVNNSKYYYSLANVPGIATTVSCSTSGSVIFSQPQFEPINKRVMAYLNACVGTASYTYPIAFLKTPDYTVGVGATGALPTAISTTAVTITSATSGTVASTGTIMLEAY